MAVKLRIIVAACVLLLVALPVLSQQSRGKTEATVKGKKITIDYGRPALQGRDMIGMARPGMVWRLGMMKPPRSRPPQHSSSDPKK